MRPYSRRLQLAFLTLACLALYACGEASPVIGPGSSTASVTPTPKPAPARTPPSSPIPASAVIPPQNEIYFGAYPDTSGLPGGDNPSATAALESELGRPLALHLQFKDFGADLDSPSEIDDFNHFRMTVLSLACIDSDRSIVNGKYDSTIQLMAQDAITYRWPIFVRYMPDVNLPAGIVQNSICWDSKSDDPGKVFSPTEFIAAWKHIHDMFVAAGAVNVVWVWTVSASSLGGNALPYYPGSSEVDWVAMDDYDVNNEGFTPTFLSLYSQLAPLGKPIMISETGVLPGEQPTFFGAAVQSLKTNFPLVQAFVYYDSISFIQGQNQDWRIAPNNFAGFSNFANDPYMSAVFGE